MAVETIKGTYTSTKMDAIGAGGVKAHNYFGRVRTLNDVGEFPVASSVTSTISFGRIPLRAVILGASRLSSDQLHASATLDLGVKNDSAKGISSKTAALVAAAAMGSGAISVSAISAVNIDKTGKMLWEILGLASDPGGDAELVVTLGGNAGAGTVALDLLFVVD
jgi:hypothetical protein